MKKRFFLSIFALLLLSGCSRNQESTPQLVKTVIPKVFHQIRFSDSIPFLKDWFNKLKEQGNDCYIYTNQYFDTHRNVCNNITGYDIVYTISNRHLKFKSFVGYNSYSVSYPWVLYKKRNSAFYITGDKVISLALREEEMYNNPKNNKIWYSGDFWEDNNKLIKEQSIKYIQIASGENVKTTIQKLKKEEQLEGHLLEESFCDFSGKRPAFYVKSGVCFIGQYGRDENNEGSRQELIYIFLPNKKYYYKLSHVVGGSLDEGFGFGWINFFTE